MLHFIGIPLTTVYCLVRKCSGNKNRSYTLEENATPECDVCLSMPHQSILDGDVTFELPLEHKHSVNYTASIDVWDEIACENMFNTLDTKENLIMVTPLARKCLVQYFTELSELILFLTGMVIHPNLGHLVLSMHDICDPGIHRFNLSTIQTEEKILPFGMFGTAEWAIAKVRENRGEFCSVDVAEADRQPIIVCLNWDTNIVCQKQKRDRFVDI